MQNSIILDTRVYIVLLGVARSINRGPACADPEIFMRGGPTKKLIFGHRRGGSGGGGVQPPKHPEITFFF